MYPKISSSPPLQQLLIWRTLFNFVTKIIDLQTSAHVIDITNFSFLL